MTSQSAHSSTVQPSTSVTITSESAGRPQTHLKLPGGLDDKAVRSAADEVMKGAGSDVPVDLVLLPAIVGYSTDLAGNRVPPDQVAERVLKVLSDARHTDDAREPVGVALSADVELSGLRGKTVVLTWEMWQVDGKFRLHGDWLNTNLAYELRPSTDHDTTSVDLWVPLPKDPGEYKVHVDLTLDGRNVASNESPPFK
ncbi:hypothetical protein [Amycolatopsis sp. RTGN1]|uniref:hypothetical protein n=1 Tax=Amycolatopsis ponsaeliensis TaxID=2992142 RepID=UPI002550F96E|nr:hypothetical protein [Amycolatopsis sp. RTGN1]